MATYRPEFETALRLFARASTEMVRRGFLAPVLVGGGAVELYTSSKITTGDFDIVTARQSDFEDVLIGLGFTKPERIGHTPLGWVHPDLRLGFEVVSSSLFAGMADRGRVVLVDKAEATTVSQTWPPKQPIAFAALAADVARRQAAFGPLEAPRNDGNRRTDSKRALLRAIAAAGGTW